MLIKIRVKLFFVVAVILLTAIVSSVQAQSSFSDVSAGHWAGEAISWGLDHKVLEGYEDGSFAPRKPITEAEFLKIVITAYESLPDRGENWFDKYYAYAYEKGWYVNGLKDQTAANKPILRKGAAIILSSALGNSYPDDKANSMNMAVTELYTRGLSNGKTEKTIEGFAPDEHLTRAEAVQFVFNFAKKSGIHKLSASIADSEWAAFESVDFRNDKGLMSKHELFAKKYGLKVITYDSAGWTYLNMVSDIEPSTQTSDSAFHLSSAYKTDEDGTVKWTLVADLDSEDPYVSLELLARIFSYDPEFHDYIKLKLIPTIKYKGVKINGRMRATFNNLEIVVRYDEASNNYYISSTIKP